MSPAVSDVHFTESETCDPPCGRWTVIIQLVTGAASHKWSFSLLEKAKAKMDECAQEVKLEKIGTEEVPAYGGFPIWKIVLYGCVRTQKHICMERIVKKVF